MKRITLLLAAISFTAGSWVVPAPSMSADSAAQGSLLDVRAFGDLAAAVANPGSTGKTIQIASEVSCNTLTIPPDRAIKIIKGGSINNAGVLTIKGPFEAGRYRVFTGSGTVTFGPGSITEYLPEWVGAVADASTDGTKGTDSTAALQIAFDSPQPVRLGAGSYLFTNLTIPPEKIIRGYGIHKTGLIAKAGCTGVALTDKGNATKITLEDFSIYANNNAYTALIRLGYNGVPFGTEGFLNNLWVRDAHSAIGFDINGNVGHIGRILAQNTQGIRIIGTANMIGMVESFGSSGFTVPGKKGSFGAYLQDSHVDAIEIEAPATGTIPLYLAGNTQIDSLWLSFRNQPAAGGYVPLVFSHLIEIDPSATTWGINNFKLYLGANKETQSTVVNGNFKSGSVYFGGNASNGNHNGEGNYSSGMYLAGGVLAVKKQQLQAFTLRITNNNGVLQHRIGAAGNSGQTTTFASRIKGAASTYQTTPSGDGGENEFMGGVRISSASPNLIVLDTEHQEPADSLFIANITFNNTGKSYSVIPVFAKQQTGSGQKSLLSFALQGEATGENIAIGSNSIPPGKSLDITFLGFIR